MARVSEAVLICLTGSLNENNRLTIATEWHSTPSNTGALGPTKFSFIDKGEHLLLLGYKVHKESINRWIYEKQAYFRSERSNFYLEMLRLKTGKPVWISVPSVPHFPLHENGRRRLLKYIKKNRLENFETLTPA